MTEENNEQTFREAVLDMGAIFEEMESVHGVPPAVTMDIVRLQMMFMQQSQQQPARMDEPIPINSDVNEVITGEDFDDDAAPEFTIVDDVETKEFDA